MNYYSFKLAANTSHNMLLSAQKELMVPKRSLLNNKT